MRRRHRSAGDAGGPETHPSPLRVRRGGRGLRRLAAATLGRSGSTRRRSVRARRCLAAATLAGALLLASACEVGVGVDIDVAENGSGTVTVGVSLDRAAADALGDLVNQIDLEDLALAGWSVSGPAREADNLLWVRAAKPFGNAEELPSILAEIAGPGVFQDVDLRQRSEFAEQTWELAGEVDPAAALPELLDTIAFNEGLQQRIRAAVGGAGGEALTRGLTMRLGIDLPGDLRSGGGDFTWEALGEGSIAAPVQISMVSTDENTTAKTLRLVGLAAAALFALALLLNLLGWWYVRRHRKRRERALLARAGSEEPPATAAAEFEPAGGTGPTTGIDDDVDWEELEHAEYEDLSIDAAGLADDLAVSGTDTSAGDWTASLEATPPAGAEAATGAEGRIAGEPEGADAVQPAAEFEPAEPPTIELPPAEAQGADAVEPAAALEAAAEPEAADVAEPDDEPPTVEQPPDEAETTGQAGLIDPPETFDEAASTGEPDAAEATEPARAADAAGTTTEPGPIHAAETAAEPEATEPARAADAVEPAEATDEPGTAEAAEATEPARAADAVEPAETAEAAAEPADEPPADDQTPDETPAAPEFAPAAAPPPARALRLVVIGGWGVLFQPADPAGELLIPFVRQSGSTARAAEIREAYRLATLGRLSPAQLWEACGLTGEPSWTHGPYTGRMTVSSGAADFVRSLLRRRIAVGCIVNDVSEWSWRLRAWTGFEEIAPWVVSSDIGIRKPDPGVFEMLRRVSDVPFANCLVIDSDIPTLDAARSLGMSTALFGPRDPDRPAPDTAHPAAGDFTDLLRRTR